MGPQKFKMQCQNANASEECVICRVILTKFLRSVGSCISDQ